jgi:hypothetical protein
MFLTSPTNGQNSMLEGVLSHAQVVSFVILVRVINAIALLQCRVENPTLKSFMAFAENCQRRRTYDMSLISEKSQSLRLIL